MIDAVKEDLKHIPEGPDFARQGDLRMLYINVEDKTLSTISQEKKP